MIFADRVDRIAKELDADRRSQIDRKYIDDAAAVAEVANRIDPLRPFITILDQPCQQFVPVYAIALVQLALIGVKLLG